MTCSKKSKRIINSFKSLTMESIPDIEVLSFIFRSFNAQGLKLTLVFQIKTLPALSNQRKFNWPRPPQRPFPWGKINSFLWVVLLQSTLQIKGFAANVCKQFSWANRASRHLVKSSPVSCLQRRVIIASFLLYLCLTTLPALPHWFVPLMVRNGEWRHWRKMPFFRLSNQTMIVLKSHFTTHCHVCKAWGNGASQGAVRLLRRMQVVQVDVKRRGDKNVNKWHRGLRSHYTRFKFPQPAHLGANGLLIWSISPKARLRKTPTLSGDQASWTSADTVVPSSPFCRMSINMAP